MVQCTRSSHGETRSSVQHQESRAQGRPKPRRTNQCVGSAHPIAPFPHTQQSRNLPTARIIPASPPLIPPTAMQRITPFLFEFSRLLSIVPAFCGTVYCIYRLFYPDETRIPGARPPPGRVDYFISALWVRAHYHLLDSRY